MWNGKYLIAVIIVTLLVAGARTVAQRAQALPSRRQAFSPVIPKTWDDAAMATLEVPLADPVGSPNHVSADYYYRTPVRPIYKSYPIYAPGHEPQGYMDWLKRQEPQIVWDDKGHAPPLKTQADWIKAGEMVFDAPVGSPGSVSEGDVRNPAWYHHAGVPTDREGIMPFLVYVIRKKGTVEIGVSSCGTCHTRLMPGGKIVKGAQGNFPFERALFGKPIPHDLLLPILQDSFGAPWIKPDPLAPADAMSAEQIAAMSNAIPAGVVGRQGTSILYPVQTPDLIGVKDRRYLDHTGLQQHRSITDLMRYATINQGEDLLASFAGFIPAGTPPRFEDRPDPAKSSRYSDEQLYALALYVYSLKPPPNPNKFDTVAAHGKKVFEREGCAMCHTPPLYTNNKLTLAEGFTPPPGADKKYDILPISVGTDPGLATKTRRGTGYYKVPSLKGVWYRSMFGHSGWCATLEDWFDPRRTHDDYVPTGFKPYGAKTYPVKGHPFGLDLSAEDKKALIAFLKTL
ncbi:MAG TPA: hypothetical protein VGV68_07815 [Terriglobia bacterium]|nr:hypothetical protein [Terriglobia bacterium]